MSSIYKEASNEIFTILKQLSKDSKDIKVFLSFFEISGEYCLDLLNQFNQVPLISSSDGSFHPIGVMEIPVTSSDEMIQLIQHGCNIRYTAGTGVNDVSSRSHAIVRIYFQYNQEEGVLNLVDLAGSEHRIDSMYHSSNRRKEGAFINSSLMALKECIRYRAQGKNYSHNYRKSKLTMALKSSFTHPKANTLIIATISPASNDTEHSLNTLRHACIMNGSDDPMVESTNHNNTHETRFLTGGSVEIEYIASVDMSKLASERFQQRKQLSLQLKSNSSDLKSSNGNHQKVKENRKDDEVELTCDELQRNRQILEKKSLKKLNPAIAKLLIMSRQEKPFRLQQEKRLYESLDSIESQLYITSTNDKDTISSNEVMMINSKDPDVSVMIDNKSNKHISMDDLYNAIFRINDNSNDRLHIPEKFLIKQLRSILKLHGYKDIEILQFIASKIQSLSPPPQSIHSPNAKDNIIHNNNNNMTNDQSVAIKTEKSQVKEDDRLVRAMQQLEVPVESRMKKCRESVRSKRVQLPVEQERISTTGTWGSNDIDSQDANDTSKHEDINTLISQLESQASLPNQPQHILYGLKIRIAKLKAEVLREKRKKDSILNQISNV